MIKYIKGDATYPERVSPEGTKIIIHIVNDIGSGLAGGNLEKIEKIINEIFKENEVYVYEF